MDKHFNKTITDDLSKLIPMYATPPLMRMIRVVGSITKDAQARRRDLELECGHTVRQEVPIGTRMPSRLVHGVEACPYCTEPSFSLDGVYSMERWVYTLLVSAGRRRVFSPWLDLISIVSRQGLVLPEVWAAVQNLLDDKTYPLVDEFVALARLFARGPDETTMRQLTRIREHLPKLVALVLSDPYSRPC